MGQEISGGEVRRRLVRVLTMLTLAVPVWGALYRREGGLRVRD